MPQGLRTPLREALAEARIGTEIYYPLGLHQQECFRYLGYQPNDRPETRREADEVLALPIFPELRAEEQKHVVEQIAAFFARGAAAATPFSGRNSLVAAGKRSSEGPHFTTKFTIFPGTR